MKTITQTITNFFITAAFVIAAILAVIGTFLAFCFIKAVTLAWTIFLLISAAVLIIFFLIAMPIYEYFNKEKFDES